MDPQIGRAGFRIAFYVIIVSGVMLFFLQPGTAEFVISALSLAIGLLFAVTIGVLAFVASRIRRRGIAPPTMRQDAGEDPW
ncbi:MAG TPA: hypothetical protein G4O02_14410 [Caldilineae bacterium]|jgi:uncharacterized membrane protein|nr:hypothetical protein [Caldilineae bacterium]